MNKIIYILIVLATIFILSCQKQPVVKTTAIAPMDGEWTVKVFDKVPDTFLYSTVIKYNTTTKKLDTTYTKTFTLYTSNTAANDKDSLIMRFTFKTTYQDTFPTTKTTVARTIDSFVVIGKLACNIVEKTFFRNDGLLLNAVKAGTPNTFTISSGKMLLNAARPPSGSIADSIIFFIDKAGSINKQYRVSGFRKTLWPEDVAW